ncbi:helix-turn-helix transcriptional regulator [Cellulosimicrobium funkei]|nr:helix-turn-helix transcriptional regulator [Cellulosimicrobium funkei]
MDKETDEAVIGRTLRMARKTAGITQEELADLVGISDRTVRHIEKGSPAPSIGSVVAVANALGLSIKATF